MKYTNISMAFEEKNRTRNYEMFKIKVYDFALHCELLVWLVLHQLCLGCASSHHPTGHYYSSLAWHSGGLSSYKHTIGLGMLSS